MKIIKLKYTDEAQNWVSIEFEDGSKGQSSLTDGIRRQYTDAVAEYITNGGVIEPMFTDEELAKNIENEKRAICSKEILEKYPLWKQSNILMAGDAIAIASMKSFIDEKVRISNEL